MGYQLSLGYFLSLIIDNFALEFLLEEVMSEDLSPVLYSRARQRE